MAFRKGQAQRITVGMYDSSTPTQLKSGLTVSATVSKDGGAGQASANSVSEVGTTGLYSLLLTASEMDADVVSVKLTATGAADTVVTTYTEKAPAPSIRI